MNPVITARRPRNHSGVPLGGIGAGKVEFCADGRFTNITTNNNIDCPIIDETARTPMMPRIIEGFEGSAYENRIRWQSLFAAEGLPGAWLAVHTPVEGARVLKTHARPAFAALDAGAIEYEGRFPRARVTYQGFANLELKLEAFGSFDLVDESAQYKHSALPLALFVFDVTNRHSRLLPVTLAFSWQNLNGVGGYAGTPINRPDKTPPVYRESAFGPGLWFTHDPSLDVDPRVLGDYSVRGWAADSSADFSYYAGWDPRGSGQEVWESFAANGRLANVHDHGVAGALAIRLTLEPDSTSTAVFALGWNMPHLLAAELKWDHLVRPSSAPPPPTDTNRRDYGHIYNSWFEDSWAAAEYGLQRWSAIRERIERWQGALDHSSLPPRLALALCNDLCAHVGNTFYTREGLYAMNEAPTDMNGCMGTLDQRAAGNAAVASFLAGLNRAELGLFARDQIRSEDDPRRFGLHWNTLDGQFDRVLDRAGAILHDIGWDHLEGGRTGDKKWTSAHWPELTSSFILQNYQYALWSGDADWLDRIYPQMKAALEFQARLDQDGDGAPDLWGPGCCIYDTELYPHYGASSYVTGLYLAALRVVEFLARERNDSVADVLRARYERALGVLENELWDERLGYYIAWRDKTAEGWALERAHGPSSTNCHISQLAGAWWADLLGLDPIVRPERHDRAIQSIHRMNVAPISGCPADEATREGDYLQSMAAVTMAYYGAHAIAAGHPDLGWDAVEKTYRVRYILDGCPWDAPLQWSGPGNEEPQWGRWYMSHPASWYLPLALAGVRLDRLRGKLTVTPRWPSTWDDAFKMPIFLPGFEAEVQGRRLSAGWGISFRIRRIVNGPVVLNSVGTRQPPAVDAARLRADVTGSPTPVGVNADGSILLEHPLTLAQENDGFSLYAIS